MPRWNDILSGAALEAPLQCTAAVAGPSEQPPGEAKALQCEVATKAEPWEQAEVAAAESKKQPAEEAEAERTYEVIVQNVALRARPSTDGDVIFLLHQHERICGVCVHVDGEPWLRLSRDTLQSHPQASWLSEEHAWVLIDATRTAPGLGVLLERAPTELAWCAPSGRSDVWEVTGERGVQVRRKQDLSSALKHPKLEEGSLVKALEVDLAAGRMHYALLTGIGPEDGWVSLSHMIKVSNRMATQQPAEEAVEPPPQDPAQAEQALREYARLFMGKPEINDVITREKQEPSGSPVKEPEFNEQLARELAPEVPQSATAEDEPDMLAQEERCSFCQLPLGDVLYRRNQTQNCKDDDLIHAECMAQVVLQGLKKAEQDRLQKEQLMKRKRRQEFAIGWNAERVPRNAAAAAIIAGRAVPEGLCALRVAENNRIEVVPTTCPAAAVNLEYLSIALTIRFEHGTEPVFSLDPVDPQLKHSMQVKRFEPYWLKSTCVGDVLFEADYLLKELSMGEREQPVVGMKSCLDLVDKDCRDTASAAREWFVVQRPEVQMSEDGVLVPMCRMAVEAREQTLVDGHLEDMVVTRPDHPLVKYAEAFTHYFDLIAERKSAIFHLRELAKASILAKHLHESGAELEDVLFELFDFKEDNNCILQVPQLWNERVSSLIHVNDGTLRTGKGVRPSLRAVYGGVQFGLNRFRLSGFPSRGAIIARRGLVTGSSMAVVRPNFRLGVAFPARASPAPIVARRGFMPSGTIMARRGFPGRGRGRTPTQITFSTGSATPALQGVDLRLNKFGLGFTVPTARTEPLSFGQDLSSCLRLGNAFWRELEKQDSVLGEEQRRVLTQIFDPNFSDRRLEGDLFTPPDTGYAYGAKLRSLLREEEDVRQKRKLHFFSADFVVSTPGPLFPYSWASEFEIVYGCAPEKVPPPKLGQLQARAGLAAHRSQIQQALASSAPTFERSTEEGLSWRIYRLGSLEVRTVKSPDGPEDIGAVFSFCSPAKEKQAFSPNPQVDKDEKIAKIALFVEGDPQDPDPLGCQYFVLAETEEGNTIVTEKLKDGVVTWEEHQRSAEDRLSAAKVLCVQGGLAKHECCATVHSLWIYKASQSKAARSRRARRLYAQGVFKRVASKATGPQVPVAGSAVQHYPQFCKGDDVKAEDKSS